MTNLKRIISFILCAVIFCTVFATFVACNSGDGGVTTPQESTRPAPSQTTGTDKETGGETTAPETDPTETSGQGMGTTESQPGDTVGNDTVETPSSSDTQKPIEPAKSSGRFVMATGTSLDFWFDWKINGYEDGYVLLQVDVVLSTYQLYISARNNLGIITVNGEAVRFSTEKIEQGENKKVDVPLHSEILRVKVDENTSVLDISVKWFFNGSYKEVEFEWLEASGVIPLS